MNNRTILIEIFCPVIHKRYDFSADEQLTAGETARLAAVQIMKYENNPDLFCRPDNISVFSALTSKPLDPTVKLCDYGITSGSELIII